MRGVHCRDVVLLLLCDVVLAKTVYLEEPYVGFPAPPRLIRESVRLSVSPVCLYMPAD